MASLLPAISPYIARLSLATYAKDAVSLAAVVGIAEIWVRIKSNSERGEESFFHLLKNWSSYPSAVLAATLSYSALKNLSSKAATLTACSLLVAPLLDRTIRTFLLEAFHKANVNASLRSSSYDNDHNPAAKITRLNQANAYVYQFSKAVLLSCRIGLIALSLYFTNKEFANLTTGGAPLVAAVATGLTAIPLVENALQYYLDENELILLRK